MRASIAALAVVLGACSRDVALFIPFDARASSALIAIESLDMLAVLGEPAPISNAPVRVALQIDAGIDPLITVVFIEPTLEAMMLPAGEITEVEPQALSRELPAYVSAIRAPLGETFEPIETVDGRLASFRFPPIDTPHCVANGGCVVPEARDLCATPCPAPSAIVPPDPPAPVAPPQPANLRPCPEEWIDADLDVAACSAPAIPDPIPCERGFGQRRAGASCVAFGGPCPASDWPENLPASGVVYVSPNAAPGGDGSFAAPYDSIEPACATGMIVALSKGTFREDVHLSGSCAIVGACALETRIEAIGTSTLTAAIDLREGTLELRALSISSPGRGIVAGPGAAFVVLRDVAIEGSGRFGVNLEEDASLDASAILVRGWAEAGVSVETGASAIVGDSVFDGNYDAAIQVCGTATITASALRDTRLPTVVANHDTGQAIQADCDGAQVTARNVLAERSNGGEAISIGGARVTLDHVDIRDTFPRVSDSTGGYGLRITRDSRVDARVLSIERVRGCALWAGGGRNTSIDATDVIIRDVLGDGDGRTGGRGLCLTEGRFHFARLEIDRVSWDGVLAADGARVMIEDAWLHDSVPTSTSAKFNGLALVRDARGGIARTRMDRLTFGALFIAEASTATISDLFIRDVEKVEFAQGIAVSESNLKLERVHLERIEGFGALMQGRGELFATDLAIEDSGGGSAGNPCLSMGPAMNVRIDRLRCARIFGGAILGDSLGALELNDMTISETVFQSGETLGASHPEVLLSGNGWHARLARVSIDGSRETALVLDGLSFGAEVFDFDATGSVLAHNNSRLDLSRSRVERGGLSARTSNVIGADVSFSGALEIGGLFGYAADIGSGSTVELVRVDLLDSMGGVLVHGPNIDYDAGQLDLHDGRIAGNGVAVVIEADGYDLVRLLDRVSFERNDRVFELR